MENEYYRLIAVCATLFIFLGWIPILAFGHAISSIVKALRHTTDISVDSIVVNAQNIENLDDDIIDKIVLDHVNKGVE